MEALFFIAHSDAPATPGVLAGRLGATVGAVTQLVAGFEREVVRPLAPRFHALDDAEVEVLASLLHRTTGMPS